MTRPTKHPKSGVYRIRVAVPAHLRDIVQRDHGVRSEFIETLGTKDPRQAKHLAGAVLQRFQGWLRAAEAEHQGETVHLSDREIATLCGEWLARQEARYRDNLPGTREEHEERANGLLDILQELEQNGGTRDALLATEDTARALMTSRGITPDRATRLAFATRLLNVQLQWEHDAVERLTTGRWTPTLKSEDFPTNEARCVPEAPGFSMDDLLAGWALDRGWKMDAQPVPRALYDRLRTMERLAAFLGHRSASRVTKADGVRWKAEMMGNGLHASTVRNDLSEMSAVWKWGLGNDKLSGVNPFAGISPPKAPRKGREPRAFTNEEAAQVLRAAREETGALRWLPWVLCLTGARLAEVCQSVKEDVSVEDGVTVLRIHDVGEGRSVKNADSRRTVPLHPALRSEGFLAYVVTLPSRSPLFPDIKPDAIFGQRAPTATRLVARWLRSDRVGITDKRISPAHSWRHWFITAARRALLAVEVRSAITGHSARLDESAGYGDGMGTLVHVLAEAMAKVVPPLPPLGERDAPEIIGEPRAA